MEQASITQINTAERERPKTVTPLPGAIVKYSHDTRQSDGKEQPVILSEKRVDGSLPSTVRSDVSWEYLTTAPGWVTGCS